MNNQADSEMVGLGRSSQLSQIFESAKTARESRVADLERQKRLMARDLVSLDEKLDFTSVALRQAEAHGLQLERERDSLAKLCNELEVAVDTASRHQRAAVEQCETLRRDLSSLQMREVCSPPAVRLPDVIKSRSKPTLMRRVTAYVLLRYARSAARQGRVVEAELLYQALILFRPRAFLFRQAACMLERQGYAESAALLFADAHSLNRLSETGEADSADA